MSPSGIRSRRPSVTVTHEKAPKGTPRAPPRRDAFQSAYGNNVANTIVFPEPLVITARPPVATSNKAVLGGAASPLEAVTDRPSVTTTIEKPEPPRLGSDAVTFAPDTITEPRPNLADKSTGRHTSMTFEPKVITAQPPTRSETSPQPRGSETIVFAPETIYGRAPPPSAGSKDPPPAARVGKNGEVVFEPDVIVGRALGLTVTSRAAGSETGPLGEIAPKDKRPISTDVQKLVDADAAVRQKTPVDQDGKASVPEDEEEQTEKQPGAPVAKDNKTTKEALPKPAVVAQQAATPQKAGDGANNGGDADLAAWRSRVSAATAATPKPTFGSAPAATVTVISGTGKSASAKYRAGGASAAKDARKAVRPPPEVPKQLPPPPPTPVPAADKLITDASDKQMPEQKLPQLQQYTPDASTSKLGIEFSMPTMDTDFASDIGSKIDIPAPEPKSELDPGREEAARCQANQKAEGREGQGACHRQAG